MGLDYSENEVKLDRGIRRKNPKKYIKKRPYLVVPREDLLLEFDEDSSKFLDDLRIRPLEFSLWFEFDADVVGVLGVFPFSLAGVAGVFPFRTLCDVVGRCGLSKIKLSSVGERLVLGGGGTLAE